jgi:hypothetical protein
MSKFITEPGEMIPLSEAGPPQTPGGLFSDLGVFGESDAAKRTALAEWLRSNEPVPNLRMALEFRGFIDADGRPLDAAQGRAQVAARDRRAAREQRVG